MSLPENDPTVSTCFCELANGGSVLIRACWQEFNYIEGGEGKFKSFDKIIYSKRADKYVWSGIIVINLNHIITITDAGKIKVGQNNEHE